MTTSYFSFQPCLLVDLNEDLPLHDLDLDQQLTSKPEADNSSSSSSPSCRILVDPPQDQAGHYCIGSHPSSNHQEADNFGMYGGGSYDQKFFIESKRENGSLKLTCWKKEYQSGGTAGDLSHYDCNDSSEQWISSKMRFIRKMMPPDHQINGGDTATPTKKTTANYHYQDQKQPYSPDNSGNIGYPNNSNNVARVCSDCFTTKTPLWRSGPSGPKSLCNACGIRQRKARRAMAEAAENCTVPAANSPIEKNSKVNHKGKGSHTGFGLQQKKRPKIALPSGDPRKLSVEEFALNLTNKLSLHQVLPQEEKEAAILLMALSYGLVHG
ncbi:hypothetical protein Nepgr_025628 [Nepenthes gracilis]|uniref:GATA-type domain-containing protein n=1 Tax=Nepenthes gracilis TaxID=150966 RepID=A0AAD3T6E3_NEPGR|nr:hypothetical protein Nepgr_025628 [Nepenthes gracilis]